MRRMTLITAGVLAIGSLAATSGTALAQDDPVDEATDTEPPVAAATSTTTLPLLGAGLTVDVTTDAGGGLLEVGLDSPDDFIATGIRSNKVAFTNDTDGVDVKVSTRWGGERVEARAGQLADIVGPGSWSGDVFATGEQSTVTFEVVDRGDGTPDVVNVVASPAAGAEAAVQPTEHRAHDGGHAAAVARVEFSALGQTRTLTIKAAIGTHDSMGRAAATAEVSTEATLRTSLSRVRGAQQVDGEQVGTHTWTGQLCDGPASVTYTVTEEGDITDVVAEPEARVWAKGDRAWVGFSWHEGVALHVRGDAGELEIAVHDMVRCERSQPVTNTEVAPDAVGQERDWRDHGPWAAGEERREHGPWKHELGDRRDGRDGWDRDGDRNHDKVRDATGDRNDDRDWSGHDGNDDRGGDRSSWGRGDDRGDGGRHGDRDGGGRDGGGRDEHRG